MKYSPLIVVFAVFVGGSCGKPRTCRCTVEEEGTTVTKMSLTSSAFPIPLPGGEGDPEPFNNEWETVAEYDNVSKAGMRAACPTLVEEEINETTVASATGSIGISITTIKEGERKRECEIVE